MTESVPGKRDEKGEYEQQKERICGGADRELGEFLTDSNKSCSTCGDPVTIAIRAEKPSREYEYEQKDAGCGGDGDPLSSYEHVSGEYAGKGNQSRKAWSLKRVFRELS